MESLFKWLLGVGLSIPLSIFRAFVMVSLWDWFVIPQFSTAPHINIVGALGLSCLWTLLNSPSQAEEKEAADSLTTVMISGGIHALLIWGIAYVIHLFM